MTDLSNITLDTLKAGWISPHLHAAVLRLDKLHPEVSGNKWFKLKYNISIARENNKGILTFGGAYSNHIAATAMACKLANIPCIGIIRGEELEQNLNHTLKLAKDNGMQLRFTDRNSYRNKTSFATQYPDYLIVPEGGHNAAGAKGCEEILTIHPTNDYSHILCAAGTGTTLAGLINSAAPHQKVIGIPVLKGATFLEQEVAALLSPDHRAEWELLYQFHGGGYGKSSRELINFMNSLYQETLLPTDIIYTGKMLMAFHQLSLQSWFPAGSRVLMIHTGGLQGNLSLAPNVLLF
ncbi:pyridoxal-phosphate dependent enzyme [Chitinophaga silvatica]|uniref:Pyridoxal-phosphate dependent enzyme n=1 Tax=Chitinophaga silvatica TaxID=2282649 RepID=A0A3E1Y589_9BACT|nr:pyridoxal-phosphate dependent enzyme [Chitinophaga silvatica]RFS19834.1 pyridoxal-phosphate dependent enzyme [Chitinophaga silvatica]